MKKIGRGKLNEYAWVDFIQSNINQGKRNIVFKGCNGVNKVYKDIIGVELAPNALTRRSTGKVMKGDVLLINKSKNIIPLSIKMSNVKTAWESADFALKNNLKNFLDCYGRLHIPNGVYCQIPTVEDLSPFVFGDDITNNNGAVVIQTLNECRYYDYNQKSVVIEVNRLFYNSEHLYDDDMYSPVISVRCDKGRNNHDEYLKGYRIEVVPSHIVTQIHNII